VGAKRFSGSSGAHRRLTEVEVSAQGTIGLEHRSLKERASSELRAREIVRNNALITRPSARGFYDVVRAAAGIKPVMYLVQADNHRASEKPPL